MSAFFAGGQRLVDEARAAYRREQTRPVLESLALGVLCLVLVIFGTLLSRASFDLALFLTLCSVVLQAGFTSWAWWNRLCGLNGLWVKVVVALGSAASFMISIMGLVVLVGEFISGQS